MLDGIICLSGSVVWPYWCAANTWCQEFVRASFIFSPQQRPRRIEYFEYLSWNWNFNNRNSVLYPGSWSESPPRMAGTIPMVDSCKNAKIVSLFCKFVKSGYFASSWMSMQCTNSWRIDSVIKHCKNCECCQLLTLYVMIKEFLNLIRIVNIVTKLLYSSVIIFVVVVLLIIPCLLVLVPIKHSDSLLDLQSHLLSCPRQLKTQIHL